ncbi:MAG: deoxyribodipyrimidine photo-lyase [Kiritimatiellaeota bacterium]|nr:deoxyribodipyrimidine photo-lyase [Kiritimatiellota bacterium]
MSGPVSIVWFRRDLRLADNPALTAAVARGGPIVPLFIWAPDEEAPWQPGAASRWWLHHSLLALGTALRTRGVPLIVRQGASLENLQELIRATDATAVCWNRLYEPALSERDEKIFAALRRSGVEVQTFGANLLYEPDSITKQSGGPFQVFTPYWRRCLAEPPPEPPLPAPRRFQGLTAFGCPSRFARLEKEHPAFSKAWKNPGEDFQALELLPKIDWAGGLRAAWQPGERGAQKLLKHFDSLAYPMRRDFPAQAGTSRLAPHLHFGEISPRQVWQALPASAAEFRRQLGWREFAHHLLWHFPHTATQPLRAEFARFPWDRDAATLKAWQRGRTGFPIVDAGLRELWSTGWMHNRVRMIVASFLVKDLRLAWLEGARWFWDTLVDADLANNTLGWQWAAGCGADAAPYFRVFNPALQQKKFDPAGAYIRRWLPEFGTAAYPPPLVDHDEARHRALEAYGSMRRKPA